MSTGWVTVWSGRDWVEMPVAAMKGETLVVPDIAASHREPRRGGPSRTTLGTPTRRDWPRASTPRRPPLRIVCSPMGRRLVAVIVFVATTLGVDLALVAAGEDRGYGAAYVCLGVSALLGAFAATFYLWVGRREHQERPGPARWLAVALAAALWGFLTLRSTYSVPYAVVFGLVGAGLAYVAGSHGERPLRWVGRLVLASVISGLTAGAVVLCVAVAYLSFDPFECYDECEPNWAAGVLAPVVGLALLVAGLWGLWQVVSRHRVPRLQSPQTAARSAETVLLADAARKSTPAVFVPCPGCGKVVNQEVGRCPYCQADLGPAR